jgi:Uma2 family endonuclease
MITVVDECCEVRVPAWVVDQESFRRWAGSDDLPEKIPVGNLKGEVWIDISREQIFSHGAVKSEVHRVLGSLVKQESSGLYLVNGVFFSNDAADIAGNPDALFASAEALEANRVRLTDDLEEVQGSPEMVLEVVSRGSVRKDTIVLRRAYWEAEIREYWLVDARKESLQFNVFRPTPRGYVAVRKRDGWLKSAVFG